MQIKGLDLYFATFRPVVGRSLRKHSACAACIPRARAGRLYERSSGLRVSVHCAVALQRGGGLT
jgi:hypothetical protein